MSSTVGPLNGLCFFSVQMFKAGLQKVQARSIYNKVVLIGRVGQTPEFHESKTQLDNEKKGIYTLNVVTNSSRFNKEQQKFEDHPTWHKVQSRYLPPSVDKGVLVLVEGEIQNYKKDDGVLKTIVFASVLKAVK